MGTTQLLWALLHCPGGKAFSPVGADAVASPPRCGGNPDSTFPIIPSRGQEGRC